MNTIGSREFWVPGWRQVGFFLLLVLLGLGAWVLRVAAAPSFKSARLSRRGVRHGSDPVRAARAGGGVRVAQGILPVGSRRRTHTPSAKPCARLRAWDRVRVLPLPANTEKGSCSDPVRGETTRLRSGEPRNGLGRYPTRRKGVSRCVGVMQRSLRRFECHYPGALRR